MRSENIFVNYNAILCWTKDWSFCFLFSGVCGVCMLCVCFSYFCCLLRSAQFGQLAGPIKHFTFNVARSKWLKFMAADTKIHETAVKSEKPGPQASGLKEIATLPVGLLCRSIGRLWSVAWTVESRLYNFRFSSFFFASQDRPKGATGNRGQRGGPGRGAACDKGDARGRQWVCMFDPNSRQEPYSKGRIMNMSNTQWENICKEIERLLGDAYYY